MKRTDTASRTVLRTPEKVYAALIDADAMLQWLPPTGMTARLEHFDARAGGGYRMVLTYADASGAAGKATADSDVVDVRFIELVRDVRVVQAVDFESDDPAFAGTMTMTWELSEQMTGLASRSAPTTYPPASQRKTMQRAWPARWPWAATESPRSHPDQLTRTAELTRRQRWPRPGPLRPSRLTQSAGGFGATGQRLDLCAVTS